jgi:cytoskeleton protein RodZ
VLSSEERLMTEIAPSSSQDQSLVVSASETLSGGAMLRKAREASGLHIAAMAVALKVPVKKLEALESDRFDLLPDTVFVRALASSVCRNLKIDPNPILERMPQIATPRLKTDESGINTPFRETGSSLNLPFWEQLSKPMVLAVLLLIVAILVLVFVPFGSASGTKESKAENADIVLSVPTPTAVVIDQPVSVEPPKPAPPATVIEPVQRDPQSIAQVLGTASAPIPAAIGSTSATPVAAVSVSGMVVLKARASTWVQVVDANGGVQVRKNMEEGEQISASGPIPLSVVVGRADAVEVQVQGKPFDLMRVAKENVARFEVK